MNKFIRSSAFIFWLGFALAVCGFRYDSWEAYFIMLPTIILVFCRDENFN